MRLNACEVNRWGVMGREGSPMYAHFTFGLFGGLSPRSFVFAASRHQVHFCSTGHLSRDNGEAL